MSAEQTLVQMAKSLGRLEGTTEQILAHVGQTNGHVAELFERVGRLEQAKAADDAEDAGEEKADARRDRQAELRHQRRTAMWNGALVVAGALAATGLGLLAQALGVN